MITIFIFLRPYSLPVEMSCIQTKVIHRQLSKFGHDATEKHYIFQKVEKVIVVELLTSEAIPYIERVLVIFVRDRLVFQVIIKGSLNKYNLKKLKKLYNQILCTNYHSAIKT